MKYSKINVLAPMDFFSYEYDLDLDEYDLDLTLLYSIVTF
jgi:hypothetical protein